MIYFNRMHFRISTTAQLSGATLYKKISTNCYACNNMFTKLVFDNFGSNVTELLKRMDWQSVGRACGYGYRQAMVQCTTTAQDTTTTPFIEHMLYTSVLPQKSDQCCIVLINVFAGIILNVLVRKLHLVQNSAARLIARLSHSSHVTPILLTHTGSYKNSAR